jgi:hypothetical protein
MHLQKPVRTVSSGTVVKTKPNLLSVFGGMLTKDKFSLSILENETPQAWAFHFLK